MQRLITFGCSFTYGTGLSKEDTWPKKLGNLLDVKVINKGIEGASNAEILHQILNFKFKKSDIAVIMWTLPDRDIHYVPDKRIYVQLGIWLKGIASYSDYWLRYMSEHDNGTKSWIQMHHADLFLKSIGIRYIHYPAYPKLLEKYKPKFIAVENYYDDGIQHIDNCDDGHPGVESQINTASMLYGLLNEQVK